MHHPMKAKAGNRQFGMQAGEAIGLLFADPFAEGVGIFRAGRMVFIDRKVVEFGPSAVGQTDRIYAGGQADLFDAHADRGGEGIVIGHRVIGVDHLAGKPVRRSYGC